MLPLDHAAFAAADLEALARTWAMLGFTVSPRGAYTSPDDAEARWPCRCVFLSSGWLDLHEAQGLPPDQARGPNGLLYRADDLAAARDSLAAEEPRAGEFRLERRWDDEAATVARFVYFTLRTRRAPVGLAVIAHLDGDRDIHPDWRIHANGALALAQIVFDQGAPPPTRGGSGLDPDTIVRVPEAAFAARYGAGSSRGAALVFHVGSLAQAESVLAAGGVEHSHLGDALIVPWRGDLSCAVEFRTAGP